MRRAALILALALSGPPVAARVPFVGCAMDGQVGPVTPPAPMRTPDLPPAQAGRLALYATGNPAAMAVLAPRGWHCLGVYGSNGSTLLVTPRPIDRGIAAVTRLRGPAVVLSYASGGTSGRFEVAEVVARLFPAARAFARAVEQEGLLDHALVYRPFARDRITRVGSYTALFTTPAGASGMGTQGLLVPGAQPVDGVAILDPGGDHDLRLLVARLPSGIRPLVAPIIADLRKRR